MQQKLAEKLSPDDLRASRLVYKMFTIRPKAPITLAAVNFRGEQTK